MRVFIYCRVARDDTFALEHQRFLLQLYAKRAGYTIIGAADEYGSGLTLDRPGMGKVTQAVLAGEVDVVLVHSLTRIGREWGMTQSYIDQLTRHKVKLLCIVNGKIICRKLAKKNVGFPTYFLCSQIMI